MAKLNMQLVHQLASEGVHYIVASYSGSGDSGSIDTVFASTDRRTLDELRQIDNPTELFGSMPKEPLIDGILSKFKDLIDDVIDEEAPGWELDEGAFGTIVVALPALAFYMCHHTQVTTSEYEPHDGVLEVDE